MELPVKNEKILNSKMDSRLEMKFTELLNEKNIVEQCNAEMLENLYNAYKKMPDKKMIKSELYEVFTKILNLSMSTEAFDVLYKKMNLMRDNSIKWNEILSYFLLEFHKNKLINDSLIPQVIELPLIGSPEIINSRHRVFICKIIFLPAITNNNKTVQNNVSHGDRGRYITISRDGIINYWSTNFNHQRKIEQTNVQMKSRWMITDMIAMPDVKMICISSTERNLSFYDTAAHRFELRMQIHNFKDFIVCMNYYYSTGDIKHDSCIIMGDTNGSVKFIFFNPKDRGPFKLRIDQDNLDVQYGNILKNGIYGMELKELNQIHTNWISQINYYGYFRAFISCSRCSKCSLFFGDPTGTKMKYNFTVTMGISCFTVDKERQLLFTGGPDCLVRIWNLFVSHKATAILCGHRTTISAIIFMNINDRLFTLSKDRCIKIWNITSRVCLQTYNRLPSELSDHTPMSVIYNSSMQTIIIGSMFIAILKCGKLIDEDLSDGETHTQQITRVLYNPLFKMIVTTGADSCIIVWDPWRGKRINIISNAHNQLSFLNEYAHVEITAATFDYSYQLLITGGRDGTLKIWNFNTGRCTKTMSIENKCEITDIIWLKSRILCVAWDKNITEFADIDHTDIYRKCWRKRHIDEISCAAVRHSQALVTGSYNGEIILWYLDTGQPYKSFNVMDPTNGMLKSNKSVSWIEVGNNINVDQLTLGFVRPVSVRAVLFLCSRRIGPKIGNLIVSLNSGLIQIWSHHPAGEFIKAFSAIHIIDDCCLCLATDPINNYLITGHKKGYIKVWFMRNYGLTSSLQSKINVAELRIQFPFLWKDRILRRAKRAVIDQSLPLLLLSIKGHLESINSIEFIPDANIIVSGSSDHTVRLWTLGGRYISTLGSFKEWKPILPDIPVNNYYEDYRIPPDIQKKGSSTTMRVLNGGFCNAKSWENNRKEQLKNLSDDKEEKNLLYGDRVGVKMIKDHEFTSLMHFYETPILDNSMAYIPVHTHLKTHSLTTIANHST